ncbi:hypothetical protein BZZ01_04560 [Nostocales cyanobacterium HT-58-2]|nr:hypothetical protein BZZ01_04560 [Nostocales cyanobacterium HT-58-2]
MRIKPIDLNNLFKELEEFHDGSGYIYLMEAIGFHGILPGCYLRRCKIGLSENPQKRLAQILSNQPPCDIKIIKSIYVKNMAGVESLLHKQFKNCNVKLIKSREWFDLNPLQFYQVCRAFNYYEKPNKFRIPLPLVLIGISLIGLLITSAINNHSQEANRKQYEIH